MPSKTTTSEQKPEAGTAAKAPPTGATASPGAHAEPSVHDAHAEERLDKAGNIVQRNVYWSMGAGVLPLPVFDMVATTGVQVKMIAELSKLYGVRFSENWARKAVVSLLVGIGGVSLGGLLGASLIKSIPIVGFSLGVVSVPIVSGMLTHAVGRTFIMHFEAGGTLLDFDAKAMRAHFKEEFSKAKDIVSNMKRDATASA